MSPEGRVQAQPHVPDVERTMRVRLVRDHRLRSVPRTSQPVPSDANAVQQRNQLRVVSRLARGEKEPRRQAPPVRGQVDFGAQPAANRPSPSRRRRGLRPGRCIPYFRASAERRCARTTLESTEMIHFRSPTASSFTITRSRMLSQVPSLVHSRSRSCAVFQARSGRAGHATGRRCAASAGSR